MVDERAWCDASTHLVPYIDLMLSHSLPRALEKAAREAGVPFERLSESRWDAVGEAIGPRLEVRVCEMVEYRMLCRSVFRAIWKATRRMVQA